MIPLPVPGCRKPGTTSTEGEARRPTGEPAAGPLQENWAEHPACSSPSGGECREATGEGEKCKASASRDFQPPVMIRASPSSAPVCALGHLPPLGEGVAETGERGDLIRRFAPPIHLAVPEKCCRLTLSFAFFDRCGKGALALSAPGGARTPFPRARRRLLPGGPSPSLCDTAPRRGERQAVRDRDSPCAGGDEGDADDTVELSFLYEHMDHISSFCLIFSALPSLLSFLCSCIITISVHFCALL